MRPEIEITNEMVRAAENEQFAQNCVGNQNVSMRKALEAALNGERRKGGRRTIDRLVKKALDNAAIGPSDTLQRAAARPIASLITPGMEYAGVDALVCLNANSLGGYDYRHIARIAFTAMYAKMKEENWDGLGAAGA